MKNTAKQSFLVILTGFLIIAAAGCKKEATPVGNAPSLTTVALTKINQTSAVTGGVINDTGNSPITFQGVCWSTHPSPTTADNIGAGADNAANFTRTLTGLSDVTTYYVRAFAANKNGTGYGNELSFTTMIIGDSYQGGRIAYILIKGDAGYEAGKQHGMIVATADVSTTDPWYYGANTLVNATGVFLGNGLTNTNNIIKVYGNVRGQAGYAAKTCVNFTAGGYTDWYLPSMEELQFIHLNKSMLGSFPSPYYWSSSEHSSDQAWAIDLSTDVNYEFYKTRQAAVRPVRSF